MIDPRGLLGQPIDFKGICYIHPPIVKEVVHDRNYPIYHKLLTTSQEEIEDEWTEKGYDLMDVPTPLKYLIQIYNSSQANHDLIINSFKFFLKEEINIEPTHKLIFVGNLEEELSLITDPSKLRILNEENFFEFQNTIRQSLGDDIIPVYDANMDPRRKRMLALARQRDKVKAKKAEGLDFSTTLVSTCCMNLGLNPLNIGEITIGALHSLVHTYQLKEKYELDVQSLLAGADSKKVKPKYWIRNSKEN